MAGSARPDSPIHTRREELIRPAERRREFKQREAQRYLERKERPRWALIAYGIVLLATLIIGSVTYTTYAFSKYRNEILPGVYVDSAYVGEMTSTRALDVILTALRPVYDHPVRLTYPGHVWQPSNQTIGYAIYPQMTVQRAQMVGRTETFPEQLLDRLPVHTLHSVPLVYYLNQKTLRAYLAKAINPFVVKNMSNAGLTRVGSRFVLVKSIPGERLDMNGAIAVVQGALGTLSTPTLGLPVVHLSPAVGNGVARQYLGRVENFLSHPPVYSLGKRVSVMTRADLAPMISFQTVVDKRHREIRMIVDSNAVNAWVTNLARRTDRIAQDPKLDFGDGKIQTLVAARNGRALDQRDATTKVLAAISALRPRARLPFNVAITRPPLDQTNPASLGISTLLGQGYSSFSGAGEGRYIEVKNVTSALDKTLISPGQDISFNQLVRFGWSANYYNDGEIDQGGQLVPSDHGGLQQVATTFFRALYGAGLELRERHSHAYDLQWYDNPPGEDAIVSPDGKDVTFHNNTGHYLFITTRVEPIRQEVFVYVWGPRLGWQVKILPPNILGREPHPAKRYVQNPSLSPGEQHQLAWAHDGIRTSVTRTIVFPGGKITTDTLNTHYRPWGAVVEVGAYPTPTPPVKKKAGATPSPLPGSPTPVATAPTPTAGSGPNATPTATFNH
ncbi:MAG: VanW family protein [Chloroflexota bacterium]